MKNKKDTGVWAYLKATGALEKGGDAIASAKKEYWRIKDREYKIQRRASMCENVIIMTPVEHERMVQGAKQHGLSVPNYIKQSSLAYLDHTYLVLDKLSVRKIEASLTRALSAIERISTKETKKGWFARENDFDELKRIVLDLRTEVHRELHNPSLLRTVVLNSPSQWPELIKLMTHDNKDTRD